MICGLAELRRKEVIDLETGEKLGYVDDVELDTETAALLSLVICGRERCFGLFGRESDLVIPFARIRLIGRDTILIVGEPRPEAWETARELKKKTFLYKDL